MKYKLLYVAIIGTAILMALIIKNHDSKKTIHTSSAHSKMISLEQRNEELVNDSLILIEPNENSRNEIVQKKLESFMENTAQFSAKTVQEERERINNNLTKIKNYHLEPVTYRIVDEDGAWEKNDFGNGIVRYIPVDGTLD